MAKQTKSNNQITAERKYGIETREEFLVDTKEKQSELLYEVEQLEKELDLYSNMGPEKFVRTDGFVYETQLEFGKFFKDLKESSLKKKIGEMHTRIAVNDGVIERESKKVRLLKAGVDFEGKTDEEVLALEE